MQGSAQINHGAIAAWIEGSMDPAQRQEFAAHLATCSDCHAQLSALLAARAAAEPEAAPAGGEVPLPTAARTWAIVICGGLVLALGYALGCWVWDLAHR